MHNDIQNYLGGRVMPLACITMQHRMMGLHVQQGVLWVVLEQIGCHSFGGFFFQSVDHFTARGHINHHSANIHFLISFYILLEANCCPA